MNKRDFLEDQILDMVNVLLDNDIIDPYEYVGFWEGDTTKPCEVTLGGKVVADIEFVMCTKENGEHDGCEGFNVWLKEENK